MRWAQRPSRETTPMEFCNDEGYRQEDEADERTEEQRERDEDDARNAR